MAVAKDDEMKKVEEALAKRILDRLQPVYGYPLVYPLAYYEPIATIKAYHDLILSYELKNAIAGIVQPSVSDVLKVLEAKKEGEKKPAAASLIQSEGIPVFVNPESVLYQNTEAASSLNMNEVMVGPDELNLVQEGTILQVHGVPVYVNPESVLYRDEMGDASLGLNEIEVGPDEIDLLS